MTNLEAYQRLTVFIRNERHMRDQVFKNGHKAREKKLAECDRAMESLEHLRQVAGIATETTAKQETLF